MIAHIYRLGTYAGIHLFLFSLTLTVNVQGLGVLDPNRSNAIAAKVEGRIITFEQIRQEMAPLMRQVQRASASEEELQNNLRRLQREVLQNLVDRILIIKEFERRGMQIPKAYLEGELNDLIQNEFDGDRDRFLSYLRSQDKTVRDFRDELKENIIIQVMRQQMRRTQSEISPERIEQFYKKNESQFLRDERFELQQITLSKTSDNEIPQETVDLIYEKLRDGTTFTEVAREFSQDGLAGRGGNLGWLTREDLRPELAETAFALNTGEYSEPIAFQDSIFIFYIRNKQDAGIRPLEEVRDSIEEILLNEFSREAQQRWLDRLRQRAFIEYFI